MNKHTRTKLSGLQVTWSGNTSLPEHQLEKIPKCTAWERLLKWFFLRWLFNCKIILSQHLCFTEFREIFRKCLCVLRERLVHNCQLLPLLQVMLTRLSPSRLIIRNLLLIWGFFTAGNLFLYSWIEWKLALYAYSFSFHAPFIISKPIGLCASLAKLGKQSSRRKRQM